jgi:hypothetical protein
MDREKALHRVAHMLKLACDERTPLGEREAATARVRALQERWRFTLAEIRLALARRRSEEHPRPAAPPRRAGPVVGRAFVVVHVGVY